MASSTTAAATRVQPDPSLIAGGPTVTSIRGKKRRLSGAELKARSEDARRITGYDKTSPIYGKQTPVVLGEIESFLAFALNELGAGSYGSATAEIDRALVFVHELNKRTATRKLTFAR